MQLAGLHEYFQSQLIDIRDITNVYSELPPVFERTRGVSQDTTAAMNRLIHVWRTQIAIMRRLEGHCARMVKATQSYFDRALLKASKELLTSLESVIQTIGGDEGMKLYHRLLKEQGVDLAQLKALKALSP